LNNEVCQVCYFANDTALTDDTALTMLSDSYSH